MHPILFQLGIFKIYAFGFALALAFSLSTYLVRLEARRQNIDPEVMTNLILGCVITGVAGSRLLYVLQNIKFYYSYPQQIFMLNQGGLTFYGGFIAAVIFTFIFLKRQQLRTMMIFDLFAPYLALAQAVGRVGCFLNGCCYGKPADYCLAVYFPQDITLRHPTQLYSSFGLLAIFVILRIWQDKSKVVYGGSGIIFWAYCLFYSIMRFGIEFLRGDNLRIWANLTLHQWISIGLFIISGLMLWKKRWACAHSGNSAL